MSHRSALPLFQGAAIVAFLILALVVASRPVAAQNFCGDLSGTLLNATTCEITASGTASGFVQIPKGWKVIIREGAELTLFGFFINEGTIVNNGTLINQGGSLINSGEIINRGTIANNGVIVNTVIPPLSINGTIDNQCVGIIEPFGVIQMPGNVTACITIAKDSQPNASRDFFFSGDLGEFQLDDHPVGKGPTPGEISFSVFPKSITVRELDVRGGWILTEIVCSATVGSIDLVNRSVTIAPQPAQYVTCTFVNQPPGWAKHPRSQNSK